MTYIDSSGESYFWGILKTKDGAVGRENGSKRKREREKENFPHQPAENRNDGVPT